MRKIQGVSVVLSMVWIISGCDYLKPKKYEYCKNEGICCKWTTTRTINTTCVIEENTEKQILDKNNKTKYVAETTLKTVPCKKTQDFVTYDCVKDVTSECVSESPRYAETMLRSGYNKIPGCKSDEINHLFDDNETTTFASMELNDDSISLVQEINNDRPIHDYLSGYDDAMDFSRRPRQVTFGIDPTHLDFIAESQRFDDDQIKHVNLIRSDNDPKYLNQLLLKVAFSNNAIDCRSECSEMSWLCIYGSLTDNIRESMLNAYNRLSSIEMGSRLPKSELMKIFNEQDDPCNRKNTVFEDGRITNEGDACVIRAPISEWEIGVELAIPARLAGSWSVTNGDISIAFTDQATSAELRIDDVDLNSEWGGLIRSVKVSREKVHLETVNGCVVVSY